MRRRSTRASTGTYDWSLALHDPASSPGASDALGPCHALGPDVSACERLRRRSRRARSACTATANGELPVVDDTVAVTHDGRLARHLQPARHRNGRTRLARRRQPARARNTAAARDGIDLVAARPTTRAQGDPHAAHERERRRRSRAGAQPLHAACRPTAPPSASAAPASAPCRSRSATASRHRSSGAVLSGSASARRARARRTGSGHPDRSAGGHRRGLRRICDHPARSRTRRPRRRLGRRPGDPRRDDAQPDRRTASCRAFRVSSDQQPVRAGAAATVTGLPSGASVLWGGDLPGDARRHQPRRSRSIACRTAPRGSPPPQSAGPSSTDYLYVLVDSTAADRRRRARPDRAGRPPRRLRDPGARRQRPGCRALPLHGRGQRRRAAGQPARPAVPPRLHEARHLRGHRHDHRPRRQHDDRPGDRAGRARPGLVDHRPLARARDATRGHQARSSARASRATSRSSSYAPTAASPSPARSRSTRRASARRSRSRSSGCPPGRYLVVRQFVDANGVAGPVVPTPLLIA